MDKLGYVFFPKDFISDPDVMMMTSSERGIYRDLIDLAYMSDNQIKYSLTQLAKYCNATESEVENILNLKGKKDGNFYSITSCDKRISKRNVNRANGAKGGRPKKPNQNPTQNPNETQTESPNKIKENKIKENKVNENKVFNFKNELLKYGFSEKLVLEWMQVRKNKKATNTETAFIKFIAEVEKIPFVQIDEILELCVEKSWMGFKAEWYNNLKTQNNATGTIKTNTQHPLARANEQARTILSNFTSQNNTGSPKPEQ